MNMTQKLAHADAKAGTTTDPVRGNSYRGYAVLGAILLAAVLIRLWKLGAASLWYDEAMYGWLARGFRPEHFEQPFLLVEPLFVWPLSWWVDWGASAAWLRLPSVVAGVAVVWCGARAARTVGGVRAAYYAAALLCIAPALVYYSRDAKMYAWVFLWEMMAILAAVGFGRSASRSQWGSLGAYVLAGTALCYTHFAAPLFLGCAGLAGLACLLRTWRKAIAWCLANALIVLLAIPFILMELRYRSVMRDYAFHAAPPDLRAVAIAFAHFFSAYTTQSVLLIALPLLFLAIFAFGLFRLRPFRTQLIFLFAVGLGPLAAIFVLSKVAPWSLFVDRYVIAGAGPLLVATGVILAQIPWPGLRRALLGAALLLMAAALPDVYTHALPEDPALHRGLIPRPDAGQMAAILRAQGEAGDPVLHAMWETKPALRWYAPEFRHVLADYQGQMQQSLDTLISRDYQEFLQWHPEDIRSMALPASRVWFVYPRAQAALARHVDGVAEELLRRGRLLSSTTCGEGVLQCYDLRPNAAEDAADRGRARIPAGDGAVELALLPAESGPAHTFQLTVANAGTQDIAFQFQQIPCSAALSGNALEATLGAESRWVRGAYLAPGGTRNAMTFRVHAQASSDDMLRAALALPEGDYALFLERTVGGPRYTIPTASIDIALEGDETTTLVSAGLAGEEAGGWTWERLGTVRAFGRPLQLRLRATDPQARPEAYAVFSQLVFVRNRGATSGASIPGLRGQVLNCAAGETTVVMLSPTTAEPGLLVQGNIGDRRVGLFATVDTGARPASAEPFPESF